MPIYEYEATGDGCPQCLGGFEVRQSFADEPLGECPVCGAEVRRVIGAVHFRAGNAHVLSQENLERNGFTQYRRLEKGVYEKTAGDGPSVIHDSD